MLDLLDEFRALVAGLAAAGVEFAVCGGLAVAIHTRPRATVGVDLSLDLLVVTPALEQVWETRERIAWQHGTVPVVSRRGLAVMKRLRGSGQDLDDIRELETEDEA